MPTLDALEAAGYHGVQVYCSGCRMLTEVFWASLPAHGATDLERLKARLGCNRCGTVPDPLTVRPFYHDRANAIPRLDPPNKP